MRPASALSGYTRNWKALGEEIAQNSKTYTALTHSKTLPLDIFLNFRKNLHRFYLADIAGISCA